MNVSFVAKSIHLSVATMVVSRSVFITFHSQGLMKDYMFLLWNYLKYSALKINKNGILSSWTPQSFNWLCHCCIELIWSEGFGIIMKTLWLRHCSKHIEPQKHQHFKIIPKVSNHMDCKLWKMKTARVRIHTELKIGSLAYFKSIFKKYIDKWALCPLNCYIQLMNYLTKSANWIKAQVWMWRCIYWRL
jgi:hypothetical protein